MKLDFVFRQCCLSLAVGAVFTASATVLVYDGVPVTGTGVGAYSGGNAKLFGQNPTHVSIQGETNKWDDSTGTGTGTIVVSNDTLSYPPGIFLSTQPGGIKMTHAASTFVANSQRTVWRRLKTPLSGRSFYFGVLMAYNDLSQYRTGDYAVWGLTRTSNNGVSYPSADGICVGFQKSASGVNAILRVLDQVYVIQTNVTAGTHHFVGRFDYNAAGADTVYASVAPGSAEPETWGVSTTAEVLTSAQSLAYVNVGFTYIINGKWVMADEWCVAGAYEDVCGTRESTPLVESKPATNVDMTSAWMNGTVTSTGSATTVVSVYYGQTDEGAVAGAWQHVHHFPAAVTSEPQDFSFHVAGLSPGSLNYYRYAASNGVGQVFAPTATSFKWLSPSVLVSDGFPVYGVGAYAGNNASLTLQNPTHPFIVGETNAWGGQTTGVFVIDDAGLSYPAGVTMQSSGGALKMTHTETNHDMSSSFTRALSRQLVTPIAAKSFYFSTLLAYQGLDYWVPGQYFTMGLTRTQAADAVYNYPPSSGALFGFQRSATGVDAVLRVMGQAYVLQPNVAPQTTYFLVGKFEYNPAGPDTVYASIVTNSATPTAWTATATAEVLTPAQSLNWLTVGGCYGVNGGWAKTDEWLTGETYSDVVGISLIKTVITIR